MSITWRPSGIACWEGRASQPKKFEEAQQFEAALFRAVDVDVVVHRALREVGQLLQSQSPLQRPDIIRRVEAASAATPARAQPAPPHALGGFRARSSAEPPSITKGSAVPDLTRTCQMREFESTFLHQTVRLSLDFSFLYRKADSCRGVRGPGKPQRAHSAAPLAQSRRQS